MNKLEKELASRGEEVTKEQDRLVGEVKQLLESNTTQDREALRSIGLDFAITKSEERNASATERKLAKEKYGKDVVDINTINRMCLDYRLYMRPARDYRGTIPPELGSELRRYCEEKSIALPASNQYSRFYIIAPPKMFKGYQTAGMVFAQAMEAGKESINEFIASLEPDPILVLDLNGNKEKFVIIKSWGNDLTWVRRIWGFLTRKAQVHWLLNLTGLWLLPLVLSIVGITKLVGVIGNGPLITISAIVGTLVIGIVALIWCLLPPGASVRKKIREIVTYNEEHMTWTN